MTLLARFVHLGRRPAPEAGPAAAVADPRPAPTPAPVAVTAGSAHPVPGPFPAVACPSCAIILDPPPARSRRCPSCRQPVIVRRTGGRTVYLAEGAVAIYEREQQRRRERVTLAAARASWLRLARGAGVPAERVERLAAQSPDEASVAKARALYEAAAARVIRESARTGAWERAAGAGRELAAARHRAAGAPVPPDLATVAVHADAMAAQLRALRGAGTHAELVGGRCCAACRADDGLVAPIEDELRRLRLPHPACPRGLCGCEWWIAGSAGAPAQRGARRSAR